MTTTVVRISSNNTTARVITGTMSVRAVPNNTTARIITGAVTARIISNNTIVRFPCGGAGFSPVAFFASVQEFDNDEDAATAGVAYYKASASHESAYKGTFIIL